MEILQQRHNVRNDWGMLLGDNCGPQTHNSNCTETRCVASIGRKDHLISSCNTSSLATEHVCSFPIPFPVALRNLREKKLARKLVSKPSLVRCGVVPPQKKTQAGPVTGGHPRSTGTGTGTAPGGLTCGKISRKTYDDSSHRPAFISLIFSSCFLDS